MTIIFLNINKFFITVLLLGLLLLLSLLCMKLNLWQPVLLKKCQKAQILSILLIHAKKYMIYFI